MPALRDGNFIAPVLRYGKMSIAFMQGIAKCFIAVQKCTNKASVEPVNPGVLYFQNLSRQLGVPMQAVLLDKY